MREVELLHKFLTKSLPDIHVSRLKSLVCGVENALNGSKLTLTGLGRACEDDTQVKNKIKRMDRLLGNEQLHSEILDFYEAMTHLIIGNKKNPIIVVDWATLDNRNKFHVLKASVAYEGRAVTILDQVEYRDRPKKEKHNSHDEFIDNLEKILPNGCEPIIVADAAFTAKWFKRIAAKGWYWVGRLRGCIKINSEKEPANWLSCGDFFYLSTNTPKHLGEYTIARNNPLKCELFIYKKLPQGRIKKNKDGSKAKPDSREDHARAAKEPWLLASNLPRSYFRTKRVIKIYKTRMQIEETFRDTKCPHYGLGIRLTLSNTKERVSILTLISALTLLVLGILGKAGYELNLHRQFQANTVKTRKVLSLWYLGRQILQHMRNKIPMKSLEKSFVNFLDGMLCYEML